MHVIRSSRVHLNLVAYGHRWDGGGCEQTLTPHVWCNDMRLLYMFLRMCFSLSLRATVSVYASVIRWLYRTWRNGSFGVIHREEPLCCRLRRCKSDGTKEWAGVGKRISEERESATKEEGVTKVRARERTYRTVYHRIVAIGEERPPRPFSISLLRHSSTAAFNDRAVERVEAPPPTLSTSSSLILSTCSTKSHQRCGLGTQRVLATSQLTR